MPAFCKLYNVLEASVIEVYIESVTLFSMVLAHTGTQLGMLSMGLLHGTSPVILNLGNIYRNIMVIIL